MTRTVHPSEQTIRNQRLAGDPAASAWVSANAGSGKTEVLSRRVVRLLLAGVDPAKVLCLTFTKAAAATMANKVFGRLAGWISLDDDALRTALRDLTGLPADEALLSRARRLFATALDTPGGLKVFTIHAFCERVLHQFPFEANVPASFTVLDDRLGPELEARARAEVLTLAADDPDGAVGRALQQIVGEVTDQAFDTALEQMLARRDTLKELNAGPTPPRSRIAAVLGLTGTERCAELDAEVFGAGIDRRRWPELIGWLDAGTANDHRLSNCLKQASAHGDPAEARRCYQSLFFGSNGEPRADLGTKNTRAARPDLVALLESERDRLTALRDRRRTVACLERSAALLDIAQAARLRYEEEKARRGALDFHDLIAKTLSLFERTEAAWVLYKLDGGVDHVLVDEAQDTSPEQWEIVRRLTAEFTAGEGARRAVRTVFAVGDEKQSIYSFQGADPERFGLMRAYYERAHEPVGIPFRSLRLNQSFRSTVDVLDAVDAVFSRPDAFDGLEVPPTQTLHETARRDAPGRVELWPLALPENAPLPEKAWNAPFDELSSRSSVAILAERIARAVRGWTEGADALGATPPVAPGDVLILVRTRGALFEALLRALKRTGLPVAGADRIVVNAHIGVLDCLALGDALLLEADDLALASVLKSPLFDLTDDDLIALAPERRGTLRAALRKSAAEARYASAAALLDRWAEEAGRLPPFEFYSLVLGRDGSRRRMRARLGPEADDALDEFLRLALTFQENEVPTLAGFLGWVRAAPLEIKRDLDIGGGEVRVMTVHGAKGLEAKTVVLADIGLRPDGRYAPKIFPVREAGPPGNALDIPLWSPRTSEDPVQVSAVRQELRNAGEREHRRLLYVALTRAEDRLVVAGHLTKEREDPPDGSWYGLVRDGLAGRPSTERREAPELGGTVQVFRATAGELPSGPDRAANGMPGTPRLPDWLHSRAPAPANGARSVSPSRAVQAGPVARGRRASTRPEALLRGRLIHALLEHAPDLRRERRLSVLERGLAEIAPDLDAVERAALLAEVSGLFDDPALDEVFAPSGRSEVPIAGRVEVAPDVLVEVAGRVDRLVLGRSILLVDFKSERDTPATPPSPYVAQLALYRAVLGQVFPDRPIRAALLWTASRRLVELSEDALAAALAGVAREVTSGSLTHDGRGT